MEETHQNRSYLCKNLLQSILNRSFTIKHAISRIQPKIASTLTNSFKVGNACYIICCSSVAEEGNCSEEKMATCVHYTHNTKKESKQICFEGEVDAKGHWPLSAIIVFLGISDICKQSRRSERRMKMVVIMTRTHLNNADFIYTAPIHICIILV